ncbi:thiol:disulfide interchange protein DsbA/DsbL [Massilia sp. TS11]|uniref:thiol:disulfide interchange protein DsbA/DsbL n=1 Tax=Massilia sp. TS11 TaxID=2908003 RepID=UPI001EDA8C9B|nr:thiol:disulfide interchange protein DsbA/DsbL [Massilia sp. TS11]MCG2585559.1 thiol:disulfide interchange protein DsbA/DsbL [Massilia sp. TS11]
MRPLRIALLALGFAASAAFASPAEPKLGAEYIQLASPVAPAADKKVEVIEFFMLHCPHCYMLNPDLEAWVKKQGANIEFKRIHFPYTGPNDPEAHAYLTLEAMGLAETHTYSAMQAIAKLRRYWTKDEDAFNWAASAGIDLNKFKEYWNSFGVQSKMKRLNGLVEKYKVDSAPNLVIDGRYMTSPGAVMNANAGMSEQAAVKALGQTLDFLVAKVQKEKGIKPAK